MNPDKLPVVTAGEAISALHLNRIRECLKYLYSRSTARSSTTVRAKQGSGGFTFEAAPRSGGGGGGFCRHWRYRITADPENPTLYKIAFIDGLINNIAADNLGQDVSYPLTGTKRLVANVTASGSSVESFTIAAEDAAALLTLESGEGAPPSTFKVNLGVIVDGAITMFVCKNLTAQPLEVMREASGAPYGEEPFVRWYQWRLIEDPD